ncbi:helix-turn-helix transcriptional regulator [Luteibacter sp.]|uniref:helix-turn-helix domain-containing protein n=1 Tax=Luteibacter sp. TaxID=1886636 RepID=UPI0025C67D6E|nr:helix-turn-helix transcriptional regulator [Luteibacter sp.]
MTKSYGKSEAASAPEGDVPIRLMGIGTRIATLADAVGTRKTAAACMGVSADSLQRYIREENMPPFDVAVRLCVAAKARLDWLATGEGDVFVDQVPLGGFPDSQVLRHDELRMALELAGETLAGRVLPPEKHAQLVMLIYELLQEGLPEAKILHFAHRAAT